MSEDVKILEQQKDFTNEADVQECTCDKEEKTQEKMFTQSRLEEILSERLSRERKQNESLLSVKEFLKSISEKGLVKGNSYSEIAKELVDRLRQSVSESNAHSAAEEMKDAPDTSFTADKDGNTYTEKVENEEITEKMENDECTSFVRVLSSLKEKYPRTTVEELLSGRGFERFAKGRSGSIEEIFDDYYNFVSCFNGTENKEFFGNSHSDFASTAFSKHSGIPDEGSNLTKQQMEIAKSAGMSYREYAHLLESVPKRTGRTF